MSGVRKRSRPPAAPRLLRRASYIQGTQLAHDPVSAPDERGSEANMSSEDFRSEDERKEAEQDRAADEAVTKADAGPVDDKESQAAAEGLTTTPSEERAYNEHIERGAAQKGEGAPEV